MKTSNELPKEILEFYKSFDGKDALIKTYGITYEAHKIEVIAEYFIFNDKFGRRTLVMMNKVAAITEVKE